MLSRILNKAIDKEKKSKIMIRVQILFYSTFEESQPSVSNVLPLNFLLFWKMIAVINRSFHFASFNELDNFLGKQMHQKHLRL
jgi:hypothetical protein